MAVLLAVAVSALPPCGASAQDSGGDAPWMEAHGLLMDPPVLEPPRKKGEGMAKSPAPRAPVLTPRQTMEILRTLGMDGMEEPGPGAEDAPPRKRAAALSALEESYSRRVVDDLEQFGYDQLGGGAGEDGGGKERTGLPAGAVQDDFVLGSGDRLAVTFRGQRRDRGVHAVGADGMLLIDDLPPVNAAGRTVGAVRAEIQAAVDDLHNTEVYVALDSIRQIGVLVIGAVGNPGRRTLTVFDTVLDALAESGGVEKTGSLRGIKLVRDGRSMIVDLYGLLLHGNAGMDIALRDGDRIVVPPIGPTIAIAGNVKRPGIYEILPGAKGGAVPPGEASEALGLDEALDMAGGVLTPGQNRFMKLGLTPDGRETVDEVSDSYRPVFGNGSILSVAPSKEKRAGLVELTGHVRRPGVHALDKAPALSALLGDDKAFGPDIYPLIGVIARWDGGQMARQILSFPPLLVLKGRFDRKLQDGDEVRLFSREEIRALRAAKKDTGRPETRTQEETGSAEEGGGDLADDPALQSFLRERSVFVRGAVRDEGAWPVAEGATLENVVAAAGGLTLEAGTSDVEVTSAHAEGGGTKRAFVDYARTDPSSVVLAPGDSVRVNQKFMKVGDNSVLVAGEVARPGRYDLLPGDKMSDLLARAGGLTPQAYPDGAIFSRESERRAEESRFRAAARDLEQSLAAAMESGEKDDLPDNRRLSMARELIAELRAVEAVGRITVEADPGALAVQPELDMLLESGDRLYVPKRPLTVRVRGEVLSPASLQFRTDKDAGDYIAEAGGLTYNADKGRSFVLYPDGSARPLQAGGWSHAPVFIPPGSTVVVPRDPKPFDFMQTARDISQVLSNLAVTGIFLDNIRND